MWRVTIINSSYVGFFTYMVVENETRMMASSDLLQIYFRSPNRSFMHTSCIGVTIGHFVQNPFNIIISFGKLRAQITEVQ